MKIQNFTQMTNESTEIYTNDLWPWITHLRSLYTSNHSPSALPLHTASALHLHTSSDLHLKTSPAFYFHTPSALHGSFNSSPSPSYTSSPSLFYILHLAKEHNSQLSEDGEQNLFLFFSSTSKQTKAIALSVKINFSTSDLKNCCSYYFATKYLQKVLNTTGLIKN